MVYTANWVIICYRYHLLGEPETTIDLLIGNWMGIGVLFHITIGVVYVHPRSLTASSTPEKLPKPNRKVISLPSIIFKGLCYHFGGVYLQDGKKK